MHSFDNSYSQEDEEMILDENENLVTRPSSGENLDDSFGNFSLNQQTQFEKRNFFKLVPGDNIYRIMPPMFDSREKGLWAYYYSDHFGFVDSKGMKRKFLCSRVYSNRVLQPCLFCEDQEHKKAQLEILSKKLSSLHEDLALLKDHQGEAYNRIQEEISEIEQKKSMISRLISRNTAFYVNAMNQNGEFGILGLKKTVYQELVGKREKNGMRVEGMLQKLKSEENIDPLSPNEGVWFNIIRTGTGFTDIRYKVELVYETEIINGKKMRSIKKAPLTNQQKQLALTKCQNLATLFDYINLTLEEQNLVINGSPDTVTAVLNSPNRKSRNAGSGSSGQAFPQSVAQSRQPSSFNAQNQVDSSYVPSKEQLKEMLAS